MPGSVPVSAPSNVDEPGRVAADKADKPDRYGEWLADDARIWRVYGQLSKEDDKEKVQRWSGGLNNLAIFATLFSGITTAFIIESQNDLKPDFAELAYRVQNATAHGGVYAEEPFVVPGPARAVNCLWTTSLLLSLSAALIAVMGQDWVAMYSDKPVCNARQWAEVRSFRLNGVYRWYMPGVIAAAPVLLHAALFLFSVGLPVFMASDAVTRNVCVALCVVIAFLYAVTMVSPVLWGSSPFRSPATMLVRRWFCAWFQRKANKDTSRAEDTAVRYNTRRVAAACRRIQDRLVEPWAEFRRILAPHWSCVPTGCMAVFRRLCCASGTHGGSFPHDGGFDPEAPAPISEPQHAAPGCLPNILSRFPATFQNPSPTRSPALRWIWNCFSHSRAAFSRIVDDYGPDISNGWLDISETPSPALVADSLSWLSSASPSPDVAQLVLLGLCDHVTGLEAGRHPNARGLTQKLDQYAEHNWERMDMLELCRYVIICANAGRRHWPDRVKQRFQAVIDAETPISQEFLLALVHLTGGLQDAPLRVVFMQRYPKLFQNMLARVETLCARISECSPVTLLAIASIVTRPRSNPDVDPAAVGILIILMNKWCHALPPDLRLVEQMLRETLPEGTLARANNLSTLCKIANEDEHRPIDSILHSLLAFFIHHPEEEIPAQSTRDLALSFARATSISRERHSCLAAMFGNSDPRITRAAWSDLSAHDIESALGITVSPVDADACHPGLRAMVACMIARCIRPPCLLLPGTIPASARTPLPHGFVLFQLVEAMSRSGALPEDLFRPVLEHGSLANLAASLCAGATSPGDGDVGSDFFWVLGAVAQWVGTRDDVRDRLELFDLFTAHPTITGSDDAAWDLVGAIGTALASALRPSDYPASLKWLFVATQGFMSAMKKLRAVFPERTLWADIASQFGVNKYHFPPTEWRRLHGLILDTTGVDPEPFTRATPLRSAGAAVQGTEAATSGTSERTSLSAGANILSHPTPHIGDGTASSGLPHGGP